MRAAVEDRAGELGKPELGGDHTHTLTPAVSGDCHLHSAGALTAPRDLRERHGSASHLTAAANHESEQVP
ncbi:MAG: hypothetical protein ACRDLT_07590 [Solirubrobacteraceae bacterium]